MNILIAAITFIIIAIVLYETFKKRICPVCKIPMVRDKIEEEIVYLCKKCGQIKRTGMYYGSGG